MAATTDDDLRVARKTILPHYYANIESPHGQETIASIALAIATAREKAESALAGALIALDALGWRVAAGVDQPGRVITSDGDIYDAVIVNGEWWTLDGSRVDALYWHPSEPPPSAPPDERTEKALAGRLAGLALIAQRAPSLDALPPDFDDTFAAACDEYESSLCLRSHCATCDSPAPHLHPAVQNEGEVSVCRDPFHLLVTPENTPEKIREHYRNGLPR